MKLSSLFGLWFDRDGEVQRFTLPDNHTEDDLSIVNRVTEVLPRVVAPASEADTDYMEPARVDSDTVRLPSAWFRPKDQT